MAEPMDITPSTSSASTMSVDVLGLINESRMTYGLRHQDYQRYREYCTNRIRRLRQILKLTQSNNKTTNVRKPLPQEFNDARYLHLGVYETERAWAFAMELKQESANSMETRHRHHLVKRLKRASQHAEALYTLCQEQTVDIRTVLDVKAYASLMKGYLYFEQQQWQEAMNQFVESRTVYEKFAKTNSTAEQEALCYSAIDEIDPNIRFCAYKLQLSGGQDVEGIVGKHQGPGMDQLKEQLAKISDDKSKDQTLKTFVWRDKQFTIKNQSLAQSVIKAQDTRKSIQPNDASAFDAVLSAWAEADKLAKKALKDDKEATAKVTSSKSAKATEDLNNLFTFVEYNLFGSSIERNVCLVEQAVEKKPQHAVKLYDDILKNLEYIWELPQVKDDMSLDGELNVLSLYYKGCRCVQVASAYNEMKKTPESLAIYQRGQTYVVQAKQALSQIRSFAQDALLKVTDSDLADLEQAIRSGTWKSRAAWYLENGSDSDEHVSEKMQQLDLNTTETLLEHLDSYPSSINPSHLVEFPPKFQPVACKPFYFDLAANFVKYPEESLAARTEKSSGSGSGFWGIFGRK
ncbi:signal recognition particle subunit srp68 [Mucor circinelloides]